MEGFIDRLTGKGFSIIISLFFLWVVAQIGLAGYKSVYNELSGINKEKAEIKSFYDTIDVIIKKQEIKKDDVLRIYNYHNRGSDLLLDKNGIANTYDDYILYRQYLDSKKPRPILKDLSSEEASKQDINYDIYPKNIQFLKETVEVLRKTQPYTVLPLREKLAIQHLHESLKTNGDNKSLKYFSDLKLVMEQRYEEYKLIDQSSEQNKIFSWISILLAVLSLFLPILGWKNIIQLFTGKKAEGSNSKEITKA